MLSVVRMFVQKTDKRAEKKVKSTSKRTMKSRRENDVQRV